MRSAGSVRLLLAGVILLCGSCRTHDTKEVRALGLRPFDKLLEPIQPPAAAPPVTAKYVAIGARLFGSADLSIDGKVACSSCHKKERAYADDVPFSTGANGLKPSLNTPSLLNISTMPMLNWHGTEKSLEKQVEHELTAPDHMGSTMSAVVQALQKSEAPAFADAFPDGVTPDNVLCVLADFVRTLSVGPSRLDEFNRIPDDEAHSAQRKEQLGTANGEQIGYVEFKTWGCASCHQGRNAGGNLLSKLSLEFRDEDSTMPDPESKAPELGRWLDTHQLDDRYIFRVPSLRAVAYTAPYFHDGSARTLEEAVAHEAEMQLGYPPEPVQAADVAAFLRALSSAATPAEGAK